MVWYTLEQLTDYCCFENAAFGTVITTSSQQDIVLFIIIGLDSSEIFDAYDKAHIQANLN